MDKYPRSKPGDYHSEHPSINVAICVPDEYGRYAGSVSHFYQSLTLEPKRQGHYRQQWVFTFGKSIHDLLQEQRAGHDDYYHVHHVSNVWETKRQRGTSSPHIGLRYLVEQVIEKKKLDIENDEADTFQINAIIKKLMNAPLGEDDKRDYVCRFCAAYAAFKKSEDAHHRNVLALVCLFYASGIDKRLEIDTNLVARNSGDGYQKYRQVFLGFESAVARFNQVSFTPSNDISGFHQAINTELASHGVATLGPCTDDLPNITFPSHQKLLWGSRTIFAGILAALVVVLLPQVSIPVLVAIGSGYLAFYSLIEMCMNKILVTQDACRTDMPQYKGLVDHLNTPGSSIKEYRKLIKWRWGVLGSFGAFPGVNQCDSLGVMGSNFHPRASSWSCSDRSGVVPKTQPEHCDPTKNDGWELVP